MSQPLLTTDDRDGLLLAAKHLAALISIAANREAPTEKFLADCAHSSAELIDLAQRVERLDREG